MATFAVFNQPEPPPSFLSKSHRFHVGAHLSHGEVTHVTGAKWTQLWSGEEGSSLAVFLTPGTGWEGGMWPELVHEWSPGWGPRGGSCSFPQEAWSDAPPAAAQEQPAAVLNPRGRQLERQRGTTERSLGTLGEPMDQDYNLWIFGSVKSDSPIILQPV